MERVQRSRQVARWHRQRWEGGGAGPRVTRRPADRPPAIWCLARPRSRMQAAHPASARGLPPQVTASDPVSKSLQQLREARIEPLRQALNASIAEHAKAMTVREALEAEVQPPLWVAWRAMLARGPGRCQLARRPWAGCPRHPVPRAAAPPGSLPGLARVQAAVAVARRWRRCRAAPNNLPAAPNNPAPPHPPPRWSPCLSGWSMRRAPTMWTLRRWRRRPWQQWRARSRMRWRRQPWWRPRSAHCSRP